MSIIEGKIDFTKGANETPNSAPETTEGVFHELNNLEKSIKENVYTAEKANDKNTQAKDSYRLKASSVNFLTLEEKNITTKEYGNSEFDHMIKTLLLIQNNNNGTGEKYNEITQGDYKTDTIKTIFSNLINFMKSKGLDRPQERTGEYTNADFLYMVGLGQALIIRDKKTERKDFSANKVSENFGDNILGKNSMTDFQSMDFLQLTTILQTKNDLEDLKKEITNTDKTEDTNNTTENKVNTTEDKVEDKVNVTEDKVNVTEDKVNVTEDKVEQKEMIGTREFPKTKDIYKEGTEQYLFNKEDLTKRGITENMEYVQTIYETLQLESNLESLEDAENLKEMLIKPRFEQMYQVILDMKSGITINGKSYEFSDNEIKNAIKNRGFSQTIRENEKLYTVIFDTRTPEMKKIENSVRPLGDKEYTQTAGKKGGLKEKYQIRPQGVLYRGVEGFNNDKIVKSISINNRALKNEEY